MPILNYTTSINAAKTVLEIQENLTRHGAREFLIVYDDNSLIKAVSFKVPIAGKDLYFSLPVDPEAILKVMAKQRVAKKYLTKEHAIKVAWRIVKDWVAAQMALLETQMVSLDQIFLPYMTNSDGKTLYSLLKGNQFLLTDGQKER